jgi:hypothetical protein
MNRIRRRTIKVRACLVRTTNRKQARDTSHIAFDG